MDAKAFHRQFYPLHPKLYRVAFALLNHAEDAEDVLQEVYCKLWIKRGELTAIEQPEAFCITLVRNLCMDILRSAARRTVCAEEIPVISSDTTPESEIESREQFRHIIALIDRLPDKQRRVIKMRGFGDCTLEEIERATGESAANVRVLLSRARKTLRNMLLTNEKI
jgi:RNA polymerase sigma-70 factor (ECF subfamily)